MKNSTHLTRIKISVISLFLMAAILSASAPPPLLGETKLSAREVQQRSNEVTRVAGTESIATMTIIDKRGRKRVRKIAQVSRLYNNGKLEKKMMKFIAPAEVKGTGLLVFDYTDCSDEKWLYMPALRKTRRIVSSENARSFMGSEFSYADITPPTLDDFNYKSLGQEQVNGVPCRIIEAIPKTDDIADENGFSRKISYFGPDFVVRRVIYFDLDGEKFKEMDVKEIREIDRRNGKFRMIHMKMKNLKNGRESIYRVDRIQFSPNTKASYFTQQFLQRG